MVLFAKLRARGTLKVFTMYYGASRDSAAAVAAGAAFGQGGYKCNPVPK